MKPPESIPVRLLLLADPSEKQIANYIKQSKIFIAEQDKVIIGVCALSETSSQVYEVHNIAVAELYQGKGIGTQLLNQAIAFANDRLAATLIICTADTSLGQLHLYKKMGFKIDAVEKDYFIRHYPEPIYENGSQCRDRVILKITF
ncbi:MAG: GNAT family N-acetyltransferase [Cyclobacteriaceae bacterium]